MKYKASVVRNHKFYIRFFCGTLEHDVIHDVKDNEKNLNIYVCVFGGGPKGYDFRF